MKLIAIALFVFLGARCLIAHASDFELRTLDGAAFRMTAAKDVGIFVFFFYGTECPMANRYLPRVDQLRAAFAERGVAVFAVNPNFLESDEAVAAHAKRFKFETPILRDVDHAAANAFGIDVTPTIVVVDAAERKIRYIGRFDDHKAPELARNHYARRAVESLLDGKQPEVSSTRPEGCFLERRRPAAATKDTWAESVAPILHRHCASCHREGQVAPFSLLSYDEARRFARTIRSAVEDRSMPPWKAAGRGHFLDERILDDEEIATISRWVEAGAPMGDPAKAPKPPEFKDGWMRNDPPDMIVETESFTVPAAGRDIYRCYVINPKLDEDKWVAAVEFRAGNPRVVHHIIAYLDSSGRAEELDRRDPDPGYKSGGTGPGFLPSGDLSGWAPGNMPYVLPDGVARLLPKAARIVLEVHYHPYGRVEDDRSQVGIWFAKAPVKKRLRTRDVHALNLKIPAGDGDYRISRRFTTSRDVHLWGIMPHMHLLGREARVSARFPDGEERVLLHLPAWDFNWQDTYKLETPLAIPNGTVVAYEARYDNSPGNPNNPNSPPKTIRWGEQTTDEMFLCYFYYTSDAEDLSANLDSADD